MQQLLTKALKQENETRWSSLYQCINSIFEMYDEAIAILNPKGCAHLILYIDKALLEQAVYFLDEFRHATLALESWKVPTIHLVAF